MHLFIILVLLLTAMTGLIVYAEQASLYSSAVSFYEVYGTGHVIFHDGAFYYASRGRAGDSDGIRYGVAGQTFSLRFSDGRECLCPISLEMTDHPGSCKRISYEKSGDYYHSLYKVSYDVLFEKLRKRYTGIELEKLMYNQNVSVTVDFYLTLVIDGEDMGLITEKDNGTVAFSGQVYNTLSGILSAADWSDETRQRLKDYFGIHMDIYQPSSYRLSFDKNDDKASGSMADERFTYEEVKKISKNAFEKKLSVSILGMEDEVIREDISYCDFYGWSYERKGARQFADEQTVSKLTDENGRVIKLYALYQKGSFTLPEISKEDLIFLGFSKEQARVCPYNISQAEISDLDLLAPGTVLGIEDDLTLYAVFKELKKTVRIKKPKGENPLFHRVYDRALVLTLRQFIKGEHFTGRALHKGLYGEGKS